MTRRRNFSNIVNSLGLWIKFWLIAKLPACSCCLQQYRLTADADMLSDAVQSVDEATTRQQTFQSMYSHSSEEDPQIRIGLRLPPAVKAALIYSSVVMETATLLSAVEFTFAQLYGSSPPVHWKPSCSESRTGSVVLSVLWGVYFG